MATWRYRVETNTAQSLKDREQREWRRHEFKKDFQWP